jgi:hypothetical protein
MNARAYNAKIQTDLYHKILKAMVTASKRETVPLGCKHRVSAPAALMSPTPTCGKRSTRHSAAMGITSHMSMRQSAAEVMMSSRRGMDRMLHNGREGTARTYMVTRASTEA